MDPSGLSWVEFDDGSAAYDKFYGSRMSLVDPDGVRTAARFWESTFGRVPGVSAGYGALKAGLGEDLAGCKLNGWDRGMSAAGAVADLVGIGLAGGLGGLARAPGGLQYHHLLPRAKEFRAQWARLELDPHDWTVIIDGDFHQDWLHGLPKDGKGGWWNREWRVFFKVNPNADIWEVMNKFYEMSKFWGIDNLKIRRYRK